jgi:hypothetical protein
LKYVTVALLLMCGVLVGCSKQDTSIRANPNATTEPPAMEMGPIGGGAAADPAQKEEAHSLDGPQN